LETKFGLSILGVCLLASLIFCLKSIFSKKDQPLKADEAISRNLGKPSAQALPVPTLGQSNGIEQL